MRHGELIAGRYRVQGQLGAGGMARVLHVLDRARSAPLALKLSASAPSTYARALFEREFAMLAGLRHPRIVEVYDYGTHGDAAYYTMELLQGSDLRTLVPMPWLDVCACLHDVASALSLLHARQTLYRDINPRNLRLLNDRRVKVLDFGALTPFGPTHDIVGTPPFVAPEVLRGEALDQRTDLYALGALGHYLLTGSHPYPARELDELPELWKQPLRSLSNAVAALGRSDRHAPPAELEQLLASLLHPNQAHRPSSAVEVIDRVGAIAGLERTCALEVAAVLRNTAFVGRARERRMLRRHVALAARRRPSSVLIEAKSGMGRSRALRELAIAAQVAGFTVVHVDAATDAGSFGLAVACAHRLRDALPEELLRAARPHASVLAHLLPELRGSASDAGAQPAELKARLHAALRALPLAVGRVTPLLLLIDDLQLADDASLAWLAGLAQELQDEALLIVATLDVDHVDDADPTLQALRTHSKCTALEALSQRDMEEMLRSVFGRATHLHRFADRLYRVTAGNAGHCLDLVEHLMQRDMIANALGTWVLPTQLIDDVLFESRAEGTRRRIERLPAPVRALAQLLSIHAAPWGLPTCVALSRGSTQDVSDQLALLTREGVLVPSPIGYRFAHEATRARLRAELAPERRRALHRELGLVLLEQAADAPLRRLEAGVHLLEASDARGPDIVAEAARRLTLESFDQLGDAVPMLERAAARLPEGAPSWERASVLAALSTAACFCDHRLLRYGEETVALLEALCGLTRARALTPALGPKLALAAGLAATGLNSVRHAHKPSVPSLRDALLLLFNTVGSLAGAHAVFLDAPSIARYSAVLAPFAVLGRDRLPALVYELTEGLRLTAEDRAARAGRHLERLLQRLDDARPIHDLPAYLRPRVLGGVLFAYGVVQAYRDGPDALAIADRLERLDIRLYALGAEEVRSVWLANQASAELAAHHRERAELHAIALGASWQVQAWAPSVSIVVAIRTRDALAAKHAAEQLERSAASMPALAIYAKMARGTYLALRGKHARAAHELQECLGSTPLAFSGYTAAVSMLAFAYRSLDQPERARALCEATLAALEPDDLCYPVLTARLEAELALSQAAVGRPQEAAAQLDAAIARHAPARGPLTLGALHEARAQVALAAGDLTAYRHHLSQMSAQYVPTGIPSLVEQCQQLTRAAAPAMGDCFEQHLTDQVTVVEIRSRR